jgi:hypothetical protein
MNAGRDAAGLMPSSADEGRLRFQVRRTPYEFALPEAGSDRQSVLAFSIRKAGSTMLYDILRVLAPAAGLTFVSISDELFLRGVDEDLIDLQTKFRDRGYCYGGFRKFPHYPVPILDSVKSILLIRDPRDTLVSAYFSATESHVSPGAEGALRERFNAQREVARSAPIDEWVLENCWSFGRRIEGYLGQHFLSRPNVVIYRYEDVVFRKRAWIEDIIGWYEWDVLPDAIEQALQLVDVFPEEPDSSKHIRQVTPGNHLSLLRPSTRERLSSVLGSYLRLFGYPTQEESPRHHLGASTPQSPIRSK